MDLEARIERQLDRLEDPNLDDVEIERVKKKIQLLKELES